MGLSRTQLKKKHILVHFATTVMTDLLCQFSARTYHARKSVAVTNYLTDVLQHLLSGNFEGKRRPAQDMPARVHQSIYSKHLIKGQHQYSADANWNVLDAVHIGTTWRIRLNRLCCRLMSNYFYHLFILIFDVILVAIPVLIGNYPSRTWYVML